MSPKIQAILFSYARAAIASAVALYMSGITDPKILMNALVAGFIAPLLRAIDPNDQSITLGKN